MGFLTSVISAGLKVALTPVALAVDIVKVPLTGDMSMDSTFGMLGSAVEDFGESVDELSDGDLL